MWNRCWVTFRSPNAASAELHRVQPKLRASPGGLGWAACAEGDSTARNVAGMDVLGSHWLIGLAGLLAVATSCGAAAEDESGAPSTSDSTYCDDLGELTGLLDGGGTVEEYNALMSRIVDESPVDHETTWSLMLVLSEEPFSYDNFNPALDSLDRIGPDLEVACAELPPMIVDDSGRIRSWPTE